MNASPDHDNSLLNTPPRPCAPHPVASTPAFDRLSPPSSPTRIIPREAQQWLAEEVADFSLNSLLGCLDSPHKVVSCGPGPVSGAAVGARTSATDGQGMRGNSAGDVNSDVNLLAVLNENGVDFTAKFDALASKKCNLDE